MRHYNIIRVSDQHISIDETHLQLYRIQFDACLVSGAFVTGVCDFTPYLKHVPHYIFEKALVKHRHIVQKLLSEYSNSNSHHAILSNFTHVLVCLAF